MTETLLKFKNRSLIWRVAVVGGGPAGLMAAHVLSQKGCEVVVFEKRKAIGRKLLIAGSSGLNITYSAPIDEFVSFYKGATREFWKRLFSDFSPQNWIQFIEDLGISTFEGTSRRYFIEDMKAPRLLTEWKKKLTEQGVQFRFEAEFRDFRRNGEQVLLDCGSATPEEFDSVCFALGGGSWEPAGESTNWPEIFKKKKIEFIPFRASNVGYEVSWKPAFLKEAERKPLKRVMLKSSRGEKMGDLMITSFGIEGTPVYFVGEVGTLMLDLKPDLSIQEIREKMDSVKENLSPMRRVQKKLGLDSTALALLFHHSSREALSSVEEMVVNIKNFKIVFERARPLEEAISSAGGIGFSECDENLMLNKYPGVFVAGEMLDWDVPTGGFLIQACVSQGHWAANGIVQYLEKLRK